MTKSIIKEFTCTVRDCFIGNGDYKDLTVVAIIVKYKLWIFTWYRIKTFKPRIRGICDGHYYTRMALSNAMSGLKEQCKYYLWKLKNSGNT